MFSARKVVASAAGLVVGTVGLTMTALVGNLAYTSDCADCGWGKKADTSVVQYFAPNAAQNSAESTGV